MVPGKLPDRFLGGNKCPGSFHLTSDGPAGKWEATDRARKILLHYQTHFAPVMLLFPGSNSPKWLGLDTIAEIARRPPSSRNTREQRAASSKLWVTTTEVN
jgi:hypothetical protein